MGLCRQQRPFLCCRQPEGNVDSHHLSSCTISNVSCQLIGLFEHLHQGQISCTVFIDSKTLITAGTDCTLAIWAVAPTSKYVDLQDPSYLFGHRAPVTVLAASRTFSTFLSASTDGKVYLWDLNRSEFVREIDAGGAAVQCARIHNTTGNIVLCCGRRVMLFTLNGHLLLDQHVCDTDDADDVVVSCAFYEGVGNEWVQRDLLFTGHRKGMVKVFKSVFLCLPCAIHRRPGTRG